VVRHEDIRHTEGLMEACEMLFGEQAKTKYDEYFQAAPG
jgi:glycerol-3-phosphate dehydrogenase